MLRKITIYLVCFCAVLALAVIFPLPAHAATVDPHMTITEAADGGVTITVPHADGGATRPSEIIVSRTKTVAKGIFGICVMVSVAAFIWQIVRLGASGGNDMARGKAIKGLLISGAAISLFGALGIFVTFFWGLLR